MSATPVPTPGPAPDEPVVRTGLGAIGGVLEDGCAVFRRVPYAAPPVGPLRFAPARAPAPWTGLLDGTRDGPISPQNASDLRHYMGDFEREQGEDCLTLTIWAPDAGAEAGPRPVLLWFHGGAFVSGAGSLPWYDGARLAREGGIVVVAANYRLGALGWLCRPGLAPDFADGNMGLSDQARALAWVAEHVAAFGGDPGAVTIGGQSAGANTTGRLLLDPACRARVRRALLQSGGFGRAPSTPEDARPTADAFLAALGIDPERPDAAERLRGAPLDRILAAQAEAEALGFTLPVRSQAFRPVFAGRQTSGDFTRAVGEAAAAAGIDLMVGYTGDEGHAFVGGPIPREPDPAVVAARFEALTGDAQARDRYAASLPGLGEAGLLAELTSDYQFVRGSLEVADAAAGAGGRVHVYLFDWTPGAAFAAGHCLDLAFLFGNWPSWAAAPMLGGSDAALNEALGRVLREGVAGFVRDGAPASAGPGPVSPWPTYDAGDRRVLRLGRRITVVRDGGGTRWPPARSRDEV